MWCWGKQKPPQLSWLVPSKGTNQAITWFSRLVCFSLVCFSCRHLVPSGWDNSGKALVTFSTSQTDRGALMWMLQSLPSGVISHPFVCCGSSFEGSLSSTAIVSLLEALIFTLKGSKNGEIREKRQFKRTSALQNCSHEDPQPAGSHWFSPCAQNHWREAAQAQLPGEWPCSAFGGNTDTGTANELPS